MKKLELDRLDLSELALPHRPDPSRQSYRELDEQTAERGIAARPNHDLPEIGGAFDPFEIARAVAEDLRPLYGKRLRKVLLFGSWARGDAQPESDIDLLVVLDRIDDRRLERGRLNEILYRHSLDNDTVVSALLVSESEYQDARRPVLLTARAEGRPIE